MKKMFFLLISVSTNFNYCSSAVRRKRTVSASCCSPRRPCGSPPYGCIRPGCCCPHRLTFPASISAGIGEEATTLLGAGISRLVALCGRNSNHVSYGLLRLAMLVFCITCKFFLRIITLSFLFTQ